MTIYFEDELGYVVVNVSTKEMLGVFPTWDQANDFVVEKAKGGK